MPSLPRRALSACSAFSCGSVHRATPCLLERDFVRGAGEAPDEGEAVAGGPVAQVGRPGASGRTPGQRAIREQQRVEWSSCGRAVAKPRCRERHCADWVWMVPWAILEALLERGRPLESAPSRIAVAASAAANRASCQPRRGARASVELAMPSAERASTSRRTGWRRIVEGSISATAPRAATAKGAPRGGTSVPRG